MSITSSLLEGLVAAATPGHSSAHLYSLQQRVATSPFPANTQHAVTHNCACCAAAEVHLTLHPCCPEHSDVYSPPMSSSLMLHTCAFHRLVASHPEVAPALLPSLNLLLPSLGRWARDTRVRSLPAPGCLPSTGSFIGEWWCHACVTLLILGKQPQLRIMTAYSTLCCHFMAPSTSAAPDCATNMNGLGQCLNAHLFDLFPSSYVNDSLPPAPTHQAPSPLQVHPPCAPTVVPLTLSNTPPADAAQMQLLLRVAGPPTGP